MKFDDSLFKFPDHIPNDLEGFIAFYPKKFPHVVECYENNVKKYAGDPMGLKQFIDSSYAELEIGFNKIKKEYDRKSKTKDLEFLLTIDQRLQKLYAFRFWVINYLFADGPLHEWHVNNLRSYVPSITDETDDPEALEESFIATERLLLQSDYADLYLINALNSVALYRLLVSDKESSNLIETIQDWLEGTSNDIALIREELDALSKRIEAREDSFAREAADLMILPIKQALFRRNREPIYQMLIQTVEFKEENIELEKRQMGIIEELDAIIGKAKIKLDQDEFKDFYTSYSMIRVLAEAKDAMGNIDPILLPFWYDLIYEIAEILPTNVTSPIGPGAAFYEFVWHMDAPYKDLIFTPDDTEFSIETL